VFAELLDTSGAVAHQGCVYFGSLSGGDYDYRRNLWEGNGRGVNIYPDRYTGLTIRYNLTGINIDKLDTVELSFVRQNHCRD